MNLGEVSGGIAITAVYGVSAATGDVDGSVVEGVGSGVGGDETVTKKGRLVAEIVGVCAAGAGGVVLLLLGRTGVPETGLDVGANSCPLTPWPPPYRSRLHHSHDNQALLSRYQ